MRQRFLAGLLLVTLAGAACSDGADPEREAVASEPSSTTTTVPAPPASLPPEPTSSSAPPPATATTAPQPVAPPAPATHGNDVAFATTVVGPAPTDPAQLAALADELVAAETRLRDPATPPADIPALARRQQAIYRAISARPEALPAILEGVPEGLRSVVDANVTAGVELRKLVGTPRTELPPWRIIPPPPPAELEGYYQEAETRFGVPWAYLAAVHLVESRMGRIRGTSTAGAQGPMQFLPATWEAYGEGGDINDPRDSILAAGRYLQRNGAPGDMAKALWNYNHSDRYVRAVTLYATQIQADPRSYLAYHAWQVYYVMTRGDVLLEEGYGA